MPNGGTSTAITPEEAAKLWAERKRPIAAAPAPANSVAITPEEAARLWQSQGESTQPPAPTGPLRPGATQPYDPAMTEKYEGGGLQAPTIDPVDVATFGVAGAGEGLAEGGIKQALRQGLGTAASFPLMERAQHLAEPVAEAIPGTGPMSQVARGTVRQAAGMAPFVAAGALPSGLSSLARTARSQSAVEEAAQKAADTARVKVTEQAAKGQESVLDTAATADQKAAKAVANFQRQQIKEAEPEATAETVGQTVAPPSGRAVMEAGPERIARGEEFRDTVMAPLQRMREDWRSRRDAAISSYTGPNPEAQPLRQQLAEEAAQWPQGHAPYSAGVNKLLAKARGLFETDPEQVAAGQAEVLTSPTGFSVSSSKGMAPMMGQIARMSPEQIDSLLAEQEKRFGPEGRKQLETALRGQGAMPERPSVQSLLALQSEAKAAARAAKGADRTAALRVARGVDDTLAGLDIPELKGINAEYRDHRLHFPYAFEDAIQKTPNPNAAAQEIFSDPERVLDLKKFGTPEENGKLNQLYADYVHENGAKALSPEVVKALGLPGPLTKPEAWLYADKTAKRLDDMMESAPQTKARVLATVSREAQAINNEEAAPIVKDAIERARTLGTVGQRIIARMNAANTPYEKAKVAVQAFTGLPIEQLAQETGEEAAVKAIQNFVPKDTDLRGMLARYAKRSAAIGGLMFLAGRPYFLEAGAAGMAIIAGPDMFRRAWLNSLKKPETALAMYRAMQNPGVEPSMKTMARAIVNSIAPAAAQVEPAVTPRTPNPAVKAAEQKKAATIAGPHASADKVDAVKTVAKNISKPTGKPANVHRDLASGRVSTSQVRQMLDANQGTDLASIFHGLTPQDAIEVLAKADAQHREALLPSVAQLINDKGKQMPPQAQQQLMAQLKSVMQQPQSTPSARTA